MLRDKGMPIRRKLELLRFNFRFNRFIAINGLETIALGLYMLLIKDIFANEQDKFVNILKHTQDPFFSCILIGIGLTAFFVAILNLHKHREKALVLSLMFGAWLTLLVILMWRDFNSPGASFGLASLLMIFVLINIAVRLLDIGGELR